MGFKNEISTSDIINTLTIIVAVIAIYFANRNSRNQIRIEKLEQLYGSVKSITIYYGPFMELYQKVTVLNDLSNDEIRTFGEYAVVRDRKISENERKTIGELLAKIEVLSQCYTSDSLREDLLTYEHLMFCFFDFISNAGSIHKELNYRDGFPDFDEMYSIFRNLQQDLLREINRTLNYRWFTKLLK